MCCFFSLACALQVCLWWEWDLKPILGFQYPILNIQSFNSGQNLVSLNTLDPQPLLLSTFKIKKVECFLTQRTIWRT